MQARCSPGRTGVVLAKPGTGDRERIAGIAREEHRHTLVVRAHDGETIDVHWSEQTHCCVAAAGELIVRLSN